MRWRSHRPLWWGAALIGAAVLAVGACAHPGPNAHTGGGATSSARPSGIPAGPATAPPGAIGRSPAGVTTRVDIPADSTEEEYYQACHAAKLWMDAQPKTGSPPLEPYLAMVQASPSGTPGSWNTRWADLTLARQAALITAARAAANDECG